MSACCNSKKTRPIAGLEFSTDEIHAAAHDRRLLSLELEMTHACNLRCLYCYSGAGHPLAQELTPDEIRDVVCQAAGMGVRKIVILGGGEPFMYPGLPELVEFIHEKGLAVEVFTNGTLIDTALARRLYQNDVSVVVKRNAHSAEIQDWLAGVPGTFARIEQGLDALFQAGYPDATHGLGIQTIICRANYDELPLIWDWARARGIQPYFECMTIKGRASHHPELGVSMKDLETMFQRLSDLDRETFNLHWTPHPPRVGAACTRHLYSILVRANGDVCPCVGVEMAIGNSRRERLADIVESHSVLEDLRNIYTTIKGPCRTCHFNGKCYGCRGNAFELTGDYLASDPCCWFLPELAGNNSPPTEVAP